jgi:hypothetical protein
MTGGITRSIESASVEVSKRKRSIRAVFSDDRPDRFRTVFDPAGVDLNDWKATGQPVLWEHGKDAQFRGTMPVAIGTDVDVMKVRGRLSLVGTCRFLEDEFSDKLFNLYADGVLKNFSINALDRHSSPPTREEIRHIPELKDVHTIYRSWSLNEVSCTAVPGNPGCNTLSVERSIDRGAGIRGVSPTLVRAHVAAYRRELEAQRAEMRREILDAVRAVVNEY